jgi:iron complex outermembrane recepter protein
MQGLEVRSRIGETGSIRGLIRYGLAAGTFGLGLARAAFAAGDADNDLQEVVVTATRHEEPLSKVPVSVSVLTQEAMDVRNIKDFTDAARFTPGVAIDAFQTNTISIRGISSSAGSGTTGVYIDDVPIQLRVLDVNADNTLPKVFDLDRIEVLRGPQGTLFGAGSEGGTVRYITTPPSLTKSSIYAHAETSYTEGGSPSYEAGVAAGAPIITDTLGVRGSIWYRRDGGWIARVDPTTLAVVDANANHDETLVMRLSALWQPSEALKVTPSMFYQSRDRHDVDYYWPIYSDPGSDRFLSANPTRLPEPDKFYLPALNVEADLGSSRLISTTSYYHRDDLSGYDGTLYNLSYYQSPGFWVNGAPPGFPYLDGSGIHLPPGLEDYRSPATIINQQRNFTEELRLQSTDDAARLSWTVGTFFSLNRQYEEDDIYDPMADEFFGQVYGETIEDAFGTALLPNGDSFTSSHVAHDRQIAGFGEANFKLTEALKLTAGVRVAKTKFSSTDSANGPQNGGLVTDSTAQSGKPVTPKVGISYQADPRDLYYATYSKGYRIGGGNSIVPADLCAQDFLNLGVSKEPTSFNSDTVKSYEIGAKNNIDNRIRLASSIYYITWNNIQQLVQAPICGYNWTENTGTAVSKGFDLQADFVVTRSLSLESALGYNSARYTKSSFAGTNTTTVLPSVVAGDAISGAGSPWTVSMGVEQRFTVLEHESFVRLDYQFHSAQKWLTAAQDPRTAQYDNTDHSLPSFTYPLGSNQFASLRAGTTLGDWSVALFADNLLNSHPTLSYNHQTYPSDPDTAIPLASPLYRNLTFRPRTIGIGATYRH